MTKIVSWDIGIKNLAFCYMSNNPENKKNPFTILKWKIINLTDDYNYECKYCNKPAIWMCGTKRYCTKHKNNARNIVLPAKKMYVKKKDCDVIFVQKNKTCNSKIKWMITDDKKNCKYYCGRHKPKDKPVMMSIKKVNATKMPIVELQKKLLEILDKMTYLLDAQVIVIENQPSFGNPNVKSISSTLFNYYLMRSTIDKDILENKIKKVVYVSSNNKLKLDSTSAPILSKTPKKKRYKKNKELSVEYCKKLLKDDKKNLDILNESKKKDDLCDCLLQGCYYLKHML